MSPLFKSPKIPTFRSSPLHSPSSHFKNNTPILPHFDSQNTENLSKITSPTKDEPSLTQSSPTSIVPLCASSSSHETDSGVACNSTDASSHPELLIPTASDSKGMVLKAGLQFPVGRIARFLKAGKHTECVSAGAPVYLTAILEYLAAEVLELAGNAVRDKKKNQIVARHIQLAARNDEELSKLLGSVTIDNGGVLPNIDQTLLPRRLAKEREIYGLLLRNFKARSDAFDACLDVVWSEALHFEVIGLSRGKSDMPSDLEEVTSKVTSLLAKLGF
ncbi:hypothetical protein QYF36_024409 [Acer negundo]|nr:hypothetical protein QYF36_024409 [Acer negundo]